MHKHGDRRDRHRRRDNVSQLQDLKAWKKRRELPPANATWPTCLIIAPSTVVHNWQREFETVQIPTFSYTTTTHDEYVSGDTLR